MSFGASGKSGLATHLPSLPAMSLHGPLFKNAWCRGASGAHFGAFSPEPEEPGAGSIPLRGGPELSVHPTRESALATRIVWTTRAAIVWLLAPRTRARKKCHHL